MATNQRDRAHHGVGILSAVGRGLLIVAVVAVLVVLLVPAVSGPRVRPSRNQCMNNLRQLAMALINYDSKHGHLPPAYTVDDAGNKLHSWRIELLPYMERQDLYDQIDLTKPWDDPAHDAVRSAMPEIFRCPSSPHDAESGLTTYCVVVGDDFIFSRDGRRSVSEIEDGATATLLVVEVPSEHAVHWMSPEDTNESVIRSLLESDNTSHPGGLVAAFTDGRVEMLPVELTQEDLRAMLTIAGADEVDE